MDNFDFKQYLVENKLTYQEKMKVKAEKKSLKEDDFINPNYKKQVGGKYVDFTKLPALFYKASEGMSYAEDEKIKEAIEAFAGWMQSKVAGTKGIGDFKEGADTKEKEKEKGHQAPKDKQKQGPSSLNESKIFFGSY
jgi:hypothetical protein